MQTLLTICLIPIITSCVEPETGPDRDHRTPSVETRIAIDTRVGKTPADAVVSPPETHTYIRVLPSFLGAPCVGATDIISTSGEPIPVPVAPLWDARFHPLESDAEISWVRCLKTGEDHDFEIARIGETVRIQLSEPTDPEWVCDRIAVGGTVLSEPYYGTLVESTFSEYVVEGEFFTGASVELTGLSDRPHTVADVVVQCRDELLIDRAWPSWVGTPLD